MGATKQSWVKRKLNGNGVPWNKGLTKETDSRVTQPWLGKKRPELKEIFTMKGKKHKEGYSEKQSILAKSKNYGKWMVGKKMSKETKEKLKNAGFWRTGEKNNMWKGGVTPTNSKIRHSTEYKVWRVSVFTRDAWTCVWCKKKGGTLNADHIKPFAYYTELRFAIHNGRTLCVDCHKTTATYGNKKLIETLYA